MRQVFKSPRHTPTLVVNQNKRNFFRMVVDSKGQDICNDKFRLTGARHTCDQAVRTVELFMQVEHKCFAISIYTNSSLERFCWVILSPTRQNIQMLNITNTKQFHKCNHSRQLEVCCRCIKRCVCQSNTKFHWILRKINIRCKFGDLSRNIILVKELSTCPIKFNYH